MPLIESTPPMDDEEYFDITKSILVLQRDEHLGALLRYLLEREGYAVQLIKDMENALLYIENAPPTDLILVGEEWLVEKNYPLLPILRNYPGWLAVPVVSLMQHFSPDQIDRELHAGVTDYLQQPFEPSVLLDRIQQYTN
ncbi:MAG: hypothetical protein HY080_00980 [Gammaproteobacteria bacterium]|nr:hypothetical protein [Gammaproteobacteria bacterium]